MPAGRPGPTELSCRRQPALEQGGYRAGPLRPPPTWRRIHTYENIQCAASYCVAPLRPRCACIMHADHAWSHGSYPSSELSQGSARPAAQPFQRCQCHIVSAANGRPDAAVPLVRIQDCCQPNSHDRCRLLSHYYRTRRLWTLISELTPRRPAILTALIKVQGRCNSGRLAVLPAPLLPPERTAIHHSALSRRHWYCFNPSAKWSGCGPTGVRSAQKATSGGSPSLQLVGTGQQQQGIT
jgi:hypothetical protein